MGLRDLELALDRLENALCGANVSPFVRSEIQLYMSRTVAIVMAAIIEAEKAQKAQMSLNAMARAIAYLSRN